MGMKIKLTAIAVLAVFAATAIAADKYSWEDERAKMPLQLASPWGTSEALANASRPNTGTKTPKGKSPDPVDPGTGETTTDPIIDGSTPVFHIQLWDAQKTDWTDAALSDLAASGFTVVQNGWSGSMLPSVTLLNRIKSHGLVYGAYISTRYLFALRATEAEKAQVHYVRGLDGTVSTSEINTLDPVYQAVVRRELTRDLALIGGNTGLFKIMLNSEHGAPVSYDDLTAGQAVMAGVMLLNQKLPPYEDGVSRLPAGASAASYADRVPFATWYESFGDDGAINRAAAGACRVSRPDLKMTTDPLGDTYTYGQYKELDILQDWVRVHQAPRDPLSIAYRVERMKAHLRHRATHPEEGASDAQIWVGPQLGTMASSGYYAAPADVFEEALWLSVAFGARGNTFWGYDTVMRSNPLDADTWSRILKYRTSLLGDYASLLLAKDAPRKVCVLLSKANQVLTSRAGYQVDENYENFYRVALTAHIPCDVVYDEDVLEGCLSKYKALILPGIEKSTPALDAAIGSFKNAGGRVVRWPVMLPTYKDFMITQGDINPLFSMTNPGSVSYLPDQYRQWRRLEAERLYATVSDLLDVKCDDPDVILNTVSTQGGNYVVAINDCRTYGAWTVARGYKWMEDAGVPIDVVVKVTSGTQQTTYAASIPAAGMVMIKY